jgi:hypothetical protein
MKITWITVALFTIVLLSACTPNTQTEPEETPKVTNFQECVAAGNPVMESYPRQCRHDGQLFVEDVEQPTSDPDKEPCTREYHPVCGKVQVQCVTAPCPPIDTTFPNRCVAENAGATDIREGACIDEDINPEGACLSFDGKWLPEYQECEGMSREQCENLGGDYNECASACRHEKEPGPCTLQCVFVCKF